MHGLGNDFVVLNNISKNIQLSPEQIRLIADRHFGIGCDQVLLVEAAPNDMVDFGYRIFNADGSVSGQCGNGARCLAKFIQYHKLSNKDSLKVATETAVMEMMILADGNVRVNMGKPNFDPAALPAALPAQLDQHLSVHDQAVTFSVVSMGNPHAVIRVDNVEQIPINEWGNAFQHNPIFPESVNIGFMQIMDPRHIKLRVFERGAGETLACGSGACAAVVIARKHKWVESKVEITLLGGTLEIEWQEPDHPVWMTGPATLVYEGVWDL